MESVLNAIDYFTRTSHLQWSYEKEFMFGRCYFFFRSSLRMVRESTVSLAMFCGTLFVTIVRSKCCSTNNDRFQRVNSLHRRYYSCNHANRYDHNAQRHTLSHIHSATTNTSARNALSHTIITRRRRSSTARALMNYNYDYFFSNKKKSLFDLVRWAHLSTDFMIFW